VWLAFTVLYLVATGRGQLTYWLARVVGDRAADRVSGEADTGRRAAVRRWLRSESVGRGRRAVERWGLVAIALSYLTVGFQTLVLAGAGLLRISWPRFTLAQFPGAVAWALIYTTIGWAAWEATLAAMAGQPLALVALGAAGLVLVATRISRRAGR
jgi:membrane protein DedA with SNARE-associated domain